MSHIKLLLFFLIAVIKYSNSQQVNEKFTLKQVVILSRHNVRTPIEKNLALTSPKPWPHWKEKNGYLTEKGALLEGFMGEYFFAWLFKEKLLTNNCPSEKDFFVYANTAQRTMLSAKSFVEKAMPLCNIKIHHAANVDPIFNPIIHNTSAIFKKQAIKAMQDHINTLHLNTSYEHVQNILDYKHSNYCIEKKKCDLVTDNNEAYLKSGSKPNISGPLKISKSVIDSFIMEYYEGFGMNEVAWGQLETFDKWQSIMDLSREYHSIIFNTSVIAKDIAKPLIDYLADIFLNENTPKVYLVMGHDANMYTILNSMGFEPYSLRCQHELAPAGGKIVFQKWSDNNGTFYLKLDYVYQCTEQMRNATPLSLSNPPEFQLLQLSDCAIDNNGFCLWEDFKKLLATL